MALPAIVIVDADPHALEALEQHVRRHCGEEYGVVAVGSAEAAPQACHDLRRRDDAVALVLAAEDVAGVRGATLLAGTRADHPNAGRVLATHLALPPDAGRREAPRCRS